MKFSERHGFGDIRDSLQINSIDTPLRNSLWNVFVMFYGQVDTNEFTAALWITHFAWTIETRPSDRQFYVNDPVRYNRKALSEIRSFWNSAEWYECYDLIEYSAQYFQKYKSIHSKFIEMVQKVLKKYMADVRFVNDSLVKVTSEEEVNTIESALNNSPYSAVKVHLDQALKHLSNRSDPDYRNSVKESISAVECLCRELTGKSSLGSALNELEATGKLHTALKEGWKKLYGYTSDGDGIRHPLMDEPNLNLDLAKFFLVSCSSFINLLISLEADTL